MTEWKPTWKDSFFLKVPKKIWQDGLTSRTLYYWWQEVKNNDLRWWIYD